METDTFPKLLLRHASERADRPALREKARGIWKTRSWRAHCEEVMALAAALADDGLRRGGYVALLGDNRPRLYAAMCAAHWLGAIVVPLYPDASAAELAQPLRDTEVTHVFAENQEQVDKLIEILPDCPAVSRIVFDKDRGMRHYQLPALITYDNLLQRGRASLAAREKWLLAEAASGHGADAAFVFFKSGTTGPSRGVVQTHGALIDRARAAATMEGLTDHDVAMAYLPPGWIGQNLFSYAQPMVAGYCVCCPESSETLLADIREVGPSYLIAPPRLLETLLTLVSLRIADSGRIERALFERAMALARRVGARILAGESVALFDRVAYAVADLAIYGPLRDVLGMSRMRTAFAAGESIDPELLLFFRALGINLKQLYGSTETGLLVAAQRNGQVKPGTVGPAAAGVELKISPQREVLVRSAGLFKAYHRDPEATALARGAEGWFHTGDAGVLDDDGHLRIIDRLKNIGALNDGTVFAPRLIESRLKALTEIKEAVVFGDGRDVACALIDIDSVAVGNWANKRNLSYTGHADLASLDAVYDLVAERIAGVNALLAADPLLAHAQIHRFAILPKELDPDDGVLTRTGKLRRTVISARYSTLINGIYEGRRSVSLESGQAVKIRDARTHEISASMKAA